MATALLNRSVFRLSGEGVQDWLAGLITNTLDEELNFAALLTPQGKIIADFFVHSKDGSIILDTPKTFEAALFKRLKMYRLRAPIDIEITGQSVRAFWGEDDTPGQADPRLPALGTRVIVDEQTDQPSADYDRHRLSLGVPDSQWDFDSVQVFPADANMDLMHGVNFSKGCFVGQEVVSRMKRMTTVKKRMRGIIIEGDGIAKPGDRILSGERVIGDVLHMRGSSGMAMIRLDRMKAATIDFTLNGTPVQIMGGVDGS